MTQPIEMPFARGTLALDATGLHLKPWFSNKAVAVPWSNVQFVHTVPAIQRVENGWQTLDGKDVTRESLARGLRFYTLEPVLKDRNALSANGSVFMWLWLVFSLLRRPLYDANGKPHPAHGVIRLRLSQHGIRKSPSALLDALGLIDQVSRFDLLVTSD